MIVTPNAVLVRPEQVHARSRAETHALAFLARYGVPQTRASYGLSLRQWFRWCDDNGIDPLEATRAQIEIFARELEATGRKLATVASKLNALAGFYRYAVTACSTATRCSTFADRASTGSPPPKGSRAPSSRTCSASWSQGRHETTP